MATPGYREYGLTQDELIDVMTSGHAWALTSDRTVDWSISNGIQGQTWAAGAAEYIGYVLASFSYFANIKFNYAGVFSSPTAAAGSGSEINYAWAGAEIFQGLPYDGIGYFPSPQFNGYVGQPGDVFFNTGHNLPNVPSFAVGSAAFALFIHETGHVLGLKHPKDGGGTGRPTLSGLGFPGLDIDVMSVMSYNDTFDWNMSFWDPASPMILDVLALQHLYGANMATNAGDSILGLAPTNFYQTLWDASGNDWASAAGRFEGWHIALPEYQLSNLVPTLAGVAAPLSEWASGQLHSLFWLSGDIENATGSQAGDQILGSSGRNTLIGAGGNDFIDGGAGIDTAVFSGTVAQYTLERTPTGVIIRGTDGVDTLTGVERLKVGSTKVAIDIDGNGGMSYRIYQAAFDRTPDLGGVGYWIGRMDDGTGLREVAANFIASPEFQTTYGPLNNNQFAAQLYRNVLHRESDPGGLAFWTNALDTGSMTKPDVLVGFSESNENKANLIGVIEHGFFYV